jgi:hypothetical protein
MYAKGLRVLCSSNCPCDADKSLWTEKDQDGMVTNAMGQSMLLDCPLDPLTQYEKT